MSCYGCGIALLTNCVVQLCLKEEEEEKKRGDNYSALFQASINYD
jgi:hypothetical protein